MPRPDYDDTTPDDDTDNVDDSGQAPTASLQFGADDGKVVGMVQEGATGDVDIKDFDDDDET